MECLPQRLVIERLRKKAIRAKHTYIQSRGSDIVTPGSTLLLDVNTEWHEQKERKKRKGKNSRPLLLALNTAPAVCGIV